MAQIVITAGRFSSLSASNRFRHRPRERVMESYFRNPRYCAANDIFDAGLRRSRHRNRFPVAAQSRGDPKDIDFGDRVGTALIAMLAEGHSSSCEQRRNLGVPSDGTYDCSGISIVERPGAFKQLSNDLVLALHRSSGKST